MRRTTDWPTWGRTNLFEELERMRRLLDWLSGGFSRGLFGAPTAGVFPLMNVAEDKDNY